MSIKNNIAAWLLSSKEDEKVSKQFINWAQLSKVLIVANDNQLSGIVDFINICERDNIYVHVAVIYNGKPEQAPKPHFEHTIFDSKQFSFFYIPTQISIQKLSSDFDVLIDLGNAEQMKLLTLSKLVPAKCKVGNFENSIFDISISDNNKLNTSDYLKQVIVYLNMIKTTHNK